ncbi:hypothetical protein INT46_010943 [Mucor plumbeus]|uniref:C2H2-type domain-containing protein n=1 Tax=Mucor plumbeus TaxID=97098 RepID=A0A8H7QT50_9FUNG|nr:hypothetical protein INT46_010943 [Mucor plumbeus]
MFPINTSTASTNPTNPTSNMKTNSQDKTKKPFPSSTLSALPFNNLRQEWPLEEYQEKRIMNALSQQQLLPPFFDEEYSDEEESIDGDDDDVDNISPTSSYFSDRALFQLNTNIRRQSLSNSLRCSICQRRFHSQGNLTNHTQLYHY